jgi:hypothetical protein
MIGLSKPLSLNQGTVTKINPHSDLGYMSGVSLVEKLGLSPENGISTQPQVGGVTADEMDFARILGTPMLVNSVAFIAGSTPIVLAYAGPYDANSTFADVLARGFGCWSGSYKLKLYIVASQFHNVKLVFWLTNNGSSDSVWENAYHQVVDVQGDTEVDMTIPFLDQKFMTTTSTGTNYGIWCRLLAWSSPNAAASCPIFINVYKSAGADFNLAVPLDLGFTPTHNPRADFAKEFPMLHPSMTGFSTDGLVIGEKVSSLRDLLHRFTPYGPSGGDYHYNPPVSATLCQGYEMWGNFFRFYRGSVRMKFLIQDSRYMQSLLYLTPFGASNATYLSTPTNPVLEAELPYYSTQSFQHTTSAFQSAFPSGGCPTYLFKSVGDDFSFHFLRAFPSGNFATPVSRGIAGLGTFSATTNVINTHAV